MLFITGKNGNSLAKKMKRLFLDATTLALYNACHMGEEWKLWHIQHSWTKSYAHLLRAESDAAHQKQEGVVINIKFDLI